MILEEHKEHSDNPHVMIFAPAEQLTCHLCGKKYTSRGKNDCGMCYECEKVFPDEMYITINGNAAWEVRLQDASKTFISRESLVDDQGVATSRWRIDY